MLAPLLRCLTVWIAATAAAAGLVVGLLPAALAPATRFDELLTRTAAILGTLATAWLWAVTTALALEARSGRVRVPAPAWLRRLVLAACGAALMAGLAAPAGATPRGPAPQTAVAVVARALAGLPLPDRPHGRAVTRDTAPVVVVAPGDSLWAIAEEHLGRGDRWPEIYALNRAVVGADPDLIHPAQRLRLPAQELR